MLKRLRQILPANQLQASVRLKDIGLEYIPAHRIGEVVPQSATDRGELELGPRLAAIGYASRHRLQRLRGLATGGEKQDTSQNN
jgi:hypothetical protein